MIAGALSGEIETCLAGRQVEIEIENEIDLDRSYWRSYMDPWIVRDFAPLGA